MKFCKECGTQLNDEAKFCKECGTVCSTPVVPPPIPNTTNEVTSNQSPEEENKESSENKSGFGNLDLSNFASTLSKKMQNKIDSLTKKLERR